MKNLTEEEISIILYLKLAKDIGVNEVIINQKSCEIIVNLVDRLLHKKSHINEVELESIKDMVIHRIYEITVKNNYSTKQFVEFKNKINDLFDNYENIYKKGDKKVQ